MKRQIPPVYTYSISGDFLSTYLKGSNTPKGLESFSVQYLGELEPKTFKVSLKVWGSFMVQGLLKGLATLKTSLNLKSSSSCKKLMVL